MKKQYTSMQQELAARKAAGGYDTASGSRRTDGRSTDRRRRDSGRALRDALPAAGKQASGKQAARKRTGQPAASKSAGTWAEVKKAAAEQSGKQAAAKQTDPRPAKPAEPPEEGRDPKAFRSSTVLLLSAALVFLGFLFSDLVINNDNGWDSSADWPAASDYGIHETSSDADVLEFIQDYSYAPDEDDMDAASLQHWLETAPDLLPDAPGSWEIAGQESRLIIRSSYDPDTEDSGEALSYWEDAYSILYDSLLDAGLEDLSVAVILRDSEDQNLYGIQIDGSTYYSAESY